MNNAILPAVGDQVKVINPCRMFYGQRGIVAEVVSEQQYRLDPLDSMSRQLWYSAWELEIMQPAQKAQAQP